MDLLRTVAPPGPPRAHGHGHDGAGLHAVARLLRGGENLLHGIYSGGRATHARRYRGGDEVRLPQMDRGPIEGRAAATDRLLQGPLQTIDPCWSCKKILRVVPAWQAHGEFPAPGEAIRQRARAVPVQPRHIAPGDAAAPRVARDNSGEEPVEPLFRPGKPVAQHQRAGEARPNSLSMEMWQESKFAHRFTRAIPLCIL